MRVHRKIHAKPFKCLHCGRGFDYSVRLQRHVFNSHIRKRPHKCADCGKTFIQPSELVVHRRSHTGKYLSTSFPLFKHLFLLYFVRSCALNGNYISSICLFFEQGEKPFACTVCNMRFTCTKLLKAHSRTHTGILP